MDVGKGKCVEYYLTSTDVYGAEERGGEPFLAYINSEVNSAYGILVEDGDIIILGLCSKR